MNRSIPTRSFMQSPVAAAVLVVLAAVLPYLHTLHYPFVLDDTLTIGENPIIQDLGRFLSGEGFRHRSLRFIGNLTLALNYHFGGLNTFGYHAVNTAIHAVAALLVYVLVQLTFRTPLLRPSLLAPRRNMIALATALLFAVHPIQTQAVTYIVQRFASLAALFYLLALVLYAWGRLRMQGAGNRESKIGSRGSRAPLLTGLLFVSAAMAAVLAMLTKEIAFTLPLMALLYEISFFPPSRRRTQVMIAGLIGALVLPLLLAATADRPLNAFIDDIDRHLRESQTVSRWTYLLTQFRVIVTYLRLLVFPVNQNLDYNQAPYHAFTPAVVLSFFCLAALVALALWLYRRTGNPGPQAPVAAADPALRVVAFGIFWFFLALAVTSSLIPIADTLVEHRLYLPSAGFALALATAAAYFGRGFRPRTLALSLAVVILVLGTATVRRNQIWRDPVTLWSDVARKAPMNERGWCNLGAAYLERGEAKKGTDHLLTAVRINPDYSKAWLNLGVGFGQQGMYPEAAQALETALVKNPKLWLAHVNLGTIYMRMGRLETAIEHLEAALRMNPGDAVARSQLDLLLRFNRALPNPNQRTAEK